MDEASRPASERRAAFWPIWLHTTGAACLLAFTAWALSPPAWRDRSAAVDVITVADGWADERTCGDCHEQAVDFWRTGHAQTLHRATDGEAITWLRSLNGADGPRSEGTTLSLSEREVHVIHQDGQFRSRATLDWCFGSGHHARTWVATLPDSYGATDLLEFRWTWYRSIDGFDVTPGQPTVPAPGYFGHLGVLFDSPKARRCFGCHATLLPVKEGQIEEGHIRAGVTCQRCHGPRAQHVASEGKIRDDFWKHAGQDESVKRCAECHRGVDDVEPADVRPENADIVRFQPIGLSLSKCYQGSGLTCLTCHDPHRPLDDQDSLGIWQCVQCHDGVAPNRRLCGAGYEDDCMSCHMPKVDMERPVQFTDHWIRVRRDKEPAP